MALPGVVGEGTLQVRRIQGTERLGRLFQYDVDLVSERSDIDFSKVLGQPVTLGISYVVKGSPAPKTRYIAGMVSSFAQSGIEGGLHQYRATVVPKVWRATRRSDCRFAGVNMKIPVLVKQIVTSHGALIDDGKLSATYPAVPYRVQYRETDFNFISRLLEQEGISYYFTHENGKHTMHLADSPESYSLNLEASEVDFAPASEGGLRREHSISSWQWNQTMQPLEYELRDFDPKQSRNAPMGKFKMSRPGGDGGLVMFDYPGEFVELSDGQRYATARLQELQCRYEVASGVCDVVPLVTGRKFKLRAAGDSGMGDAGLRFDQFREYLVTGTSISAEQDPFGSGSSGGEVYTCMFTAIPAGEYFRTERSTPMPTIAGPQTAMVVAEADEFGYVKLLFPWERDGAGVALVRVSQSWAGRKWGSFHFPRVGQEVIVEFLEGDPDRPIVTGRVYNHQSAPPYDPKKFNTLSGIKSNTYDGSGFNEIRFDDKADSEQVFVHAQKDLEVRVLNDAKMLAKHNAHVTTEKGLYEHVKGDRHVKIVGNHNEKADETISLHGGQNVFIKGGTALALEGGSEVHIKGTSKVVIESMTDVTLKVGGSFVNISAMGVSIKGPLVNINSGGSAGSGGGCSPKAPDEAELPCEAKPGSADEKVEPKPPAPESVSPASVALKDAAQHGSAFCEECEKHRQEMEQAAS